MKDISETLPTSAVSLEGWADFYRLPSVLNSAAFSPSTSSGSNVWLQNVFNNLQTKGLTYVIVESSRNLQSWASFDPLRSPLHREGGFRAQREQQEESLPLRGLANAAVKTSLRSLLGEDNMCLSTRTRTRSFASTHIHTQYTPNVTSTPAKHVCPYLCLPL